MYSESSNTEKWIRQEIIEKLIDQFNFNKKQLSEFATDNVLEKIIFKNKYEMYFVKNKMQHSGALCGFHCVFNIIYFLQYLKSEDIMVRNKNLIKMNSTVKFWKLYEKLQKFLLGNPNVTKGDKESLRKLGALERYQFKIILESYPKFKKINKIKLKFLTFFFAFNFIQGMSKQEIIDLQEAMKTFREYNKKGQKLVYVMLLGITNHWSILILENDNSNIKFYYLDSKNSNVFNIEDNQNDVLMTNNPTYLKNDNTCILNLDINKKYEDFAEKIYADIAKYRKPLDGWFKKCYIQWLHDINLTVDLFYRIIYENYSLCEFFLESVLDRFVKTFEEYNSLKLDNKTINSIINVKIISKEAIRDYKSRLILWLNVEYHPKIINVDIYGTIKSFEYDKFIEKMPIYPQFKNLLIFSLYLKNFIYIDNWWSKKLEPEEFKNAGLIERYYNVMEDLRKYLKIKYSL